MGELQILTESAENLGLGIGGNYVVDSYFEAANTITIPSYTDINASIFFDQPKWRFTIKGNNLGNRRVLA